MRAKTKTSSSFVSPYKQITDAILADLRAGVATWVKPWTAAKGQPAAISAGLPMNFATGKTYRGCNVLLMLLAQQANGWAAPAFATFKQIAAMGGTVAKGAKSSRVFFMSSYEREPRTPEEAAKVNENGMFVVRVLKGYAVFNLDQTEGLDRSTINTARPSTIPGDAAELADAISLDLRHGGDRAFYAFGPGRDFIGMPMPESFTSLDHYKATLFHEVTHWTGAAHRLDRLKSGSFGSKDYAYEELVAELGAAFLCLEMGVTGDLRHADYIGHWIKLLENDERVFYRAASDAQKAVDFVRERAGAEPSAEAADLADETATPEVRLAA